MNALIGIAHPYASDPDRNREAMLRICRQIVAEGDIPMAAAVYLPQFMDEATERERALQIACCLIAMCGELRVYGDPTPGMTREIEAATVCGIPIRPFTLDGRPLVAHLQE